MGDSKSSNPMALFDELQKLGTHIESSIASMQMTLDAPPSNSTMGNVLPPLNNYILVIYCFVHTSPLLFLFLNYRGLPNHEEASSSCK